MTKTIRSILALLLLTSATAYADRSLDDLGERMTRMMERIADDIDANKPDCEKIATALEKHADADAALMKEAIAADRGKSKDERAAENKAMEAKFGDRIRAANKKMAPLKACRNNARIRAYTDKVNL